MIGEKSITGAYLLLLRLDEPSELVIGALGPIFFEAGDYVYVGSAMGGLEQRVARHLRSKKKLQWHIDYLLQAAVHREALLVPSSSAVECVLANVVATLPGATMVRRFGCSDCRCPSHLFHIPGDMVECLRSAFSPDLRRTA
ncbi:MAG: GIY-YIG nuclease family protein [Euryarchaeota archaeon]|nr:GIY-YIG nuclease family protein [Euryarchaeota archaeon]